MQATPDFGSQFRWTSNNPVLWSLTKRRGVQCYLYNLHPRLGEQEYGEVIADMSHPGRGAIGP